MSCRIGPELTAAAQRVVDATNAPIEWEVVDNIVDKMTPEAYESLRRNHVALKGEFQVGRWSLQQRLLRWFNLSSLSVNLRLQNRNWERKYEFN